MKIAYTPRKFAAPTLAVIDQANAIITEYAAQGYDLTLRQLYYQFVSRDLIPNRQSEYKRLGSIINDARLAGLVDWEAITDRTRNLKELAHWEGPSDIVAACASQFRIDKWATQPVRVEVWIEKDALAGVFDRVCQEEDVPYFSCRGYTSQSEMWAASQRHMAHERNGQSVVILHFGDHDPSGIDMTRDIEDRLNLFRTLTEVNRLALNMVQVQAYNPPPNPAKDTDSRFTGYSDIYGDESWELDALEPSVLASLVSEHVAALRDVEAWEEACSQQDEARATLARVSDRWPEVTAFVGEE